MGQFMGRLLPYCGQREDRKFIHLPIPFEAAEDMLSTALCAQIKKLEKLATFARTREEHALANQILSVSEELVDIELDIDYYAELVQPPRDCVIIVLRQSPRDFEAIVRRQIGA